MKKLLFAAVVMCLGVSVYAAQGCFYGKDCANGKKATFEQSAKKDMKAGCPCMKGKNMCGNKTCPVKKDMKSAKNCPCVKGKNMCGNKACPAKKDMKGAKNCPCMKDKKMCGNKACTAKKGMMKNGKKGMKKQDCKKFTKERNKRLGK